MKKRGLIVNSQMILSVVILLIGNAQHAYSSNGEFNELYPIKKFSSDIKKTIVNNTRERGTLLLLTKNRYENLNCQEFVESICKSLVVISQGQTEKDIRKTNTENGTIIYEVPHYETSQSIEWITHNINQERRIEGICSIAERDVLRSGLLRTFFNIKGQSYESAQAYRDKIIMKDYVNKYDIKVPKHSRANSILDIFSFIRKNGYPVVIKPSQGAGATDAFIIKRRS